MIFLRVVAILALFPVLAAGEEGLVVSSPDTAQAAQVAQVDAAPETDAASETDAVVAEQAEPALPKVDWTQVSNPVAPSAASTDRGAALFTGAGMCHICHGEKGDGFGPVRGQFSPPPNAFFSTEWQAGFMDGELMGILTEGKLGTGMIPMVPDFITEKQAWDIINYVRTLKGRTTEDYEGLLVNQREMERIEQEAIAADHF